jgi:5-methylcytosine-specific restriction endonuclease McrA
VPGAAEPQPSRTAAASAQRRERAGTQPLTKLTPERGFGYLARQVMRAMSSYLNQQVLVLNRLWQAVNVCSVRRALILLFQGHAQVVLGDESGDFQTYSFTAWQDFSRAQPHPECIHTISFKIRVPRVILLLMFDHLPKKEVKFTRHNIFERDKNTCQYCGRSFERKDLNLDHVIPRDRGGPTTWENIVCSCVDCNTHKANRTPLEAGLRLIRKPKRPKWRPFVQINLGFQLHDSWKHFIDLAYWNVELGED